MTAKPPSSPTPIQQDWAVDRAEARVPPQIIADSRLPWFATWLWLMGPSCILLSAFLLQIGSQRQVIVPWSNWVVPETCAMYKNFRLDCPGCGLTRSFIYLAHGNWPAAWQLNPVGLFLFVFVALQIPLAVLHLAGSKSRCVVLWTQANQAAMIALMLALTLQWLYRLMMGDLW